MAKVTLDNKQIISLLCKHVNYNYGQLTGGQGFVYKYIDVKNEAGDTERLRVIAGFSAEIK